MPACKGIIDEWTVWMLGEQYEEKRFNEAANVFQMVFVNQSICISSID